MCRFRLFTPISIAINDSSELEEIGLSPLPEGTLALIEWPERAGDALPEDRIDIAFSHRPALGSTARAAEITGYGKAAAQVTRLEALRHFLEQAGFLDAERERMPGDASTRSYARLIGDDGTSILMNSPRRPDGPAIYDGKSYSAAVHLAEDVKPFVAIDNGLRAHGFSAPAIRHADLECRFPDHRGFRQRRRHRRRSAAADRRALRGGDRHAGGAASQGPARNRAAGAARARTRFRSTISMHGWSKSA